MIAHCALVNTLRVKAALLSFATLNQKLGDLGILNVNSP